MSLTFCNKYTATVSVCVVWYTPNCPDGGDWSKGGWFNMAPGECQVALNGDLTNRYVYFYAQATDGAYWAGEPQTDVPNQAFDWCIDTSNSQSRQVGLREIDTGGADNYQATLLP
jgi:uncharacterized membrane protein